MKAEEHTPMPVTRTCPRCGRSYAEHPAISRADSMTLLCPDCGTREALEAMGISKAEQEDILMAIHRYQEPQMP